VTPLASRLGIEINLGFSKGDEADLAGAIARLDGVVLVCWQHEDIIAIANAIEPRLANLPEKWSGDRFNVMFRLDRPAPGSSWVFQQIVPVLLGGDLATEI
jgi:hypothetical protein